MKKSFFILVFTCLVNLFGISENHIRSFSFDEYIFYKSVNLKLGKDKISYVLNNNKSIQQEIKEIKYLYDDANISDALLINNVYLTDKTKKEIIKSLTPFIRNKITNSAIFSEIKKIVTEIERGYSNNKNDVKIFLKSKIKDNIVSIYLASNDDDYIDNYDWETPKTFQISKIPSFINATEKGYISKPYISMVTGENMIDVSFSFFDNKTKYVIGFNIKLD